MKETRRPKRRKRDRQGNRMALIGIVFVIFSMALVVNTRSSSLRAKDLEYQVREENLRTQVEEEKKRAEDLEEKRVYVQTKQYIEKVAKEKLGLVNPDEIILNSAPFVHPRQRSGPDFPENPPSPPVFSPYIHGYLPCPHDILSFLTQKSLLTFVSCSPLQPLTDTASRLHYTRSKGKIFLIGGF